MSKTSKIISVVSEVLVGISYFVFAYAISQMFSVFPWYDESGSYLFLLFVIWIPLCMFTLINVLVKLVNRVYKKRLIMLECVNALYIPVIFAVGYIGAKVNVQLSVVQGIGIVSVVTMILYFVLLFTYTLKNKNIKKEK